MAKCQGIDRSDGLGDKTANTRTSAGAEGTLPCPNPLCRGGYAPKARGVWALRVCPSCDGYGFLRSVPENRKRYYALRNASSEIELQSRLGRGLTPQHGRRRESNEPIAGQEMMLQESGYEIEHMIDTMPVLPSCERVS